MNLDSLQTKNRERPTAFSGFWMFIAEITGVMERHCRTKHQHHHEVRQIQYDGASIIFCKHCYRTFWRM